MFWQKLKSNEWLVILALIFALSLVVAGKTIDGYLDSDGLTILDHPINQFMVSLRHPILNRFMYLITLTGNWQMLAFGTLLATILLVAAQKRRYLMAMLLSNTTALIFIDMSKNLIGRVRPPVENALILEHGFAFPSGHSYFAVVFYGLLTYFWIRHFHQFWAKLTAFIIGSSFIGLLALSRIYLGVHWSTDVVAGLSLSTAWLVVIITYIEFRQRFFHVEYKEFNHRAVWIGFSLFSCLWVLGLSLFYFQSVKILGTNIIRPISAEEQAIISTAPAATSRANVVSE